MHQPLGKPSACLSLPPSATFTRIMPCLDLFHQVIRILRHCEKGPWRHTHPQSVRGLRVTIRARIRDTFPGTPGAPAKRSRQAGTSCAEIANVIWDAGAEA